MRFNRNRYIQLTPLIMITDVTALNLVEVLMDLFVQICSSTRVVRNTLAVSVRHASKVQHLPRREYDF